MFDNWYGQWLGPAVSPASWDGARGEDSLAVLAIEQVRDVQYHTVPTTSHAPYSRDTKESLLLSTRTDKRNPAGRPVGFDLERDNTLVSISPAQNAQWSKALEQKKTHDGEATCRTKAVCATVPRVHDRIEAGVGECHVEGRCHPTHSGAPLLHRNLVLFAVMLQAPNQEILSSLGLVISVSLTKEVSQVFW